MGPELFLYALLLCTVVLICSCFIRRYSFLFYLLGFLYTHAHCYEAQSLMLPLGYQQTFVLTGEVHSIPTLSDDRVRFIFQADSFSVPLDSSLDPAGEEYCLPHCRLRVDWYRHDQIPKAGSRWQLKLTLRAVHGPTNMAGYDAVKQALITGIQGYAQVQSSSENRIVLTRDSPSLHNRLLKLRADLTLWLDNTFDTQSSAILQALLLGHRGAIQQDRWQSLQATGTGHLIAISGLHIGLVAMLGYSLTWFSMKLWPSIFLRIPAPYIAAFTGTTAAMFYALLSGWMLSTQRACIMLAITVLIILSRRQIYPWGLWLWALFATLFVAPLSALSPSLYLSFGAVALLIYAFYQRSGSDSLNKAQSFVLINKVSIGSVVHRAGRSCAKYCVDLFRVQIFITLGLLSISVYFFQSISLIGFIVNLIAVPWISLLILPLALLSLVLQLLGLSIDFLIDFVSINLSLFLAMVDYFSQMFWAHFVLSASTLSCFSALAGAIVMLSVRGMPLRWLGIVWFLPMTFSLQTELAAGEFSVYQFDVGQGQAIAVRTSHHLMLYDTGPGDGMKRNWVAAAIQPTLVARSQAALDLLVISHGDLDHAGGAIAAQNLFNPRLTLGTDSRFNNDLCERGQAWVWDGVSFKVLHPSPNLPYQGNNSSCVILVNGAFGSLLLAGDLEKEGERSVLDYARRNTIELAEVNWLTAGHHGSKTSSHPAWLDTITPDGVILSRSLYNRFGFPHTEVKERLARRQILVLDSAGCGGIELNFRAEDDPKGQWSAQRKPQHWWQKKWWQTSRLIGQPPCGY